MEESLTVRSVERSVEEVLLPALVMVGDQVGWEAECQFAFRWATGWLFAARRAAAPADRAQATVLLDSSTRLSVDSLRVQGLELGLRRASMHTVLLACDLPPHRVTGAIRRVDPMALVICGGEVRGEIVERLVRAVRQADCSAPLYVLGESAPGLDTHELPSLGPSALEATRQLKGYAARRTEFRPRTRTSARRQRTGLVSNSSARLSAAAR
jgi:hypothetical protein